MNIQNDAQVCLEENTGEDVPGSHRAWRGASYAAGTMKLSEGNWVAFSEVRWAEPLSLVPVVLNPSHSDSTAVDK